MDGPLARVRRGRSSSRLIQFTQGRTTTISVEKKRADSISRGTEGRDERRRSRSDDTRSNHRFVNVKKQADAYRTWKGQEGRRRVGAAEGRREGFGARDARADRWHLVDWALIRHYGDHSQNSREMFATHSARDRLLTRSGQRRSRPRLFDLR